ncbi:MAG TPA: trypsin-like peptidase domain-containing protein [Candidatus Acidoferrales bacterium]|nr:trypsin-like peptidase domain-containing protein [Candidatus Acidoferrales bacterium]
MPTVIVGLVGAIIGSFVMMLYASTHFATIAGPHHTPPAVAAAPLTGVSDQDRIVSAVKRTKASVVAITETLNGQQVIPVDPFIQQFFGQQGPGIVQHYKGQASGSGFVYDDQGDIVTNAHVVNPPTGAKFTDLTVIFPNGDHVPAHVIGMDIGADLAVIRVDNYKRLPPPLVLGKSDKLEQGQWAIAIGEPYQLQQTVTLGVISAFERDERVQAEGSNGVYDFKGLLQTSAPINPGNSGGPLVDIDGNVIGVNQLTDEGAQGIGFAIPSDVVASVIPNLLKNPGVHQGTGAGFAGFAPVDLNAGIRNQIGYSGKGGIAVQQVVPGTPADKGGLEPGDVILRVDGKPVTTADALRKYIAAKKPGDVIRFDVWSQGVDKLVAITLEERPAEQVGLPQQGQGQGP